MNSPPDASGTNVWLDIFPLHRTQRRPDVDTSKFDQIAQQFASDSTRRVAVKRLGALGLVALGVTAAGRAASANVDPRNDNVDKNCLNKCLRHNNHDCHDRCRRKR